MLNEIRKLIIYQQTLNKTIIFVSKWIEKW